MSKAISSATARGAPHLFKALAILADTSVGRSAVDRKDLKSCWNQKNSFVTTKRRLTGWQLLTGDLLPTLLNAWTTNETFQQSGKQDFLDTRRRVQLECVNIQAHSSLEPPLE